MTTARVKASQSQQAQRTQLAVLMTAYALFQALIISPQERQLCMATDNPKIIITWADAVTGDEETREANEQEVQELLDAGYGQNVVES